MHRYLNSRKEPTVRFLLLYALFLLANFLALGAGTKATKKVLQEGPGDARISYEESGPPNAAGCLILLHGASGPGAFYKDQAVFFGSQGYHVLMPHYFDVARSTNASVENYRKWAGIVATFAAECRKVPSTERVFLVGYSLGASVALAFGSQRGPVDAIADWYGSLPDAFFEQIKGMPPLLILHGENDTNIPIVNAKQLVKLCDLLRVQCDHHFYPDENHGLSEKAMEDAEQRTLGFFARFMPSK
jgi:carboxymethylenebutenolidase